MDSILDLLWVLDLVVAFKPISEGQIRLITSYSFGAPEMKKPIFLDTKYTVSSMF